MTRSPTTSDPSALRAANPVRATFDGLGATIEARWRRLNYDEASLPPLAAEILAAADVARKVAPADLYSWAALSSMLPQQLDGESTFGEPPLTVYSHPRFAVDVYTWFSSTTSIHQHAFSGAFYVLAGGSVQSHYHFHTDVRVNGRLLLGRLSLAEVRLLRQGDVVPIRSGDGFIHGLFHLEHPSLTLVVRTWQDPGVAPQYSYTPPGVAWDPFYRPMTLRRRVEALGALRRLDLARYLDLTAATLMEGDLFEVFTILSRAHRLLRDEDQGVFDGLCEVARRRHGPLVDRLVPAFRSFERIARIHGMRDTVTDPEHRFFLALLLNVPNAPEILRLVADRFPERAAEDTAMGWIAALADAGKLGMKLDPVQRDVLRLLLERLPRDQMLERLCATYELNDRTAAAASVDRFRDQVRRQPLFSTLFA